MGTAFLFPSSPCSTTVDEHRVMTEPRRAGNAYLCALHIACGAEIKTFHSNVRVCVCVCVCACILLTSKTVEAPKSVQGVGIVRGERKNVLLLIRV
jgi:hypothetical protein